MKTLSANTIPADSNPIEVSTKPGNFTAHQMNDSFVIHDRPAGEHHTHAKGDFIVSTAAGTVVIPKKVFSELFEVIPDLTKEMEVATGEKENFDETGDILDEE